MQTLDSPPELAPMESDPVRAHRRSVASRLASAGVHAFTALGVICALLALLDVWWSNWQGCFFWLGVAFLIDGVDGALARLVDVKKHLARFSGERLDFVIDYLTYVFIPTLALLQAGFLTGPLGMIVAALILLSSLYHFSDLENKSADNCFVGFPAIWNIVAFYLFAFDASPWLAKGVCLVFVALTFVPWRWVHPLRVTEFRYVTITVTGVCLLTALWIVWHGFPASLPAKIVLAMVACYGIGLSLVWRRSPAP
ncbi:MAG: CDP-alcohol phosphatidyltransferase family protein [Hyphomicrobiaceae bacterium]